MKRQHGADLIPSDPIMTSLPCVPGAPTVSGGNAIVFIVRW